MTGAMRSDKVFPCRGEGLHCPAVYVCDSAPDSINCKQVQKHFLEHVANIKAASKPTKTLLESLKGT